MPRRFLACLVTSLCLLRAASAAPEVTSGADLALHWPELIGQTLHLRITPVRALDVARYLVKVDKASAVLLVAPGKIWSGQKLICAAVTGEETVLAAGRARVVGLMLTECDKAP